MNFTREQEQAVRLRNCDILVSAGAGAGKTRVLVNRMAEMILDEKHPLSVDAFLVMTFTNAAAEEMRERITAELDARLEKAKELGATHVINSLKEDVPARCHELTDGYGVTVSIDAACVKTSLITALNATGSAGRVITMGFSVAPTEVNQFAITSKELDVRGSRLQNRKFQDVIDLINAGKIDLRGSISHTFPLTEAQKAFDFVDSHDPSIRKIAFTFDF